MLVCALLVAVLAVQPAIGDGKRKDKSAAAATANASKDKGSKQANVLATAKVATRAKRSSSNARAAQDTAPAATAADPTQPAESGPPANPGPPAAAQLPVDAVPSAAPEQGATATPPQAPAATAAAETPAAVTPAPVAETPAAPRDPGAALDTARGAPAAGGTAAGSPPAGESPASGSVAVAPSAPATPPTASQPNTQEPGSDAVAVPDERTATQRQRAAARARTRLSDTPLRGSAQGTQRTGVSPLTPTNGAIPSTALEAPLVTQATEAITRVRPGGRTTTSGPRPQAGRRSAAVGDVAGSGAADSSVGEVLVSWAKYALAVLALLVLALGINAIVAAARTRRLERQRERLMEDIGLLQSALLPAVPSRLGALLTTVAYRPADGPAAGGDFYDAFALPDGRVGLLLGDVSGHGRQALAKTTLVRFTVRAHLEAGLSPREALAIAGRSLDGRLSDDFATVIAAIHDPAKGTLTYASAGHPPPIVVGPSRHRAVTVSSSPPIGVGFPTGQRQTVLPMPEGSSVMIYSDGLLEARIDGVPLGPERLAGMARRAWARGDREGGPRPRRRARRPRPRRSGRRPAARLARRNRSGRADRAAQARRARHGRPGPRGLPARARRARRSTA